ncbi:hypothetical protein [Desulfosporosinus sp. BG]|nr:hypothetical protein [Desulfosporosinus sp. BG]ODA42012.1 hypothetical protein DSBG_1282 [Desulfosporosinus sp. BG]
MSELVSSLSEKFEKYLNIFENIKEYLNILIVGVILAMYKDNQK